MREYLIDAFNLFHRISSLKNSALPHSELVQYIVKNRLTGSPHNRVTIVFDGYEGEPVGCGGFNILYSDSRKADDLIKEIILRSPRNRQMVVVSDDNEIINFAKKEDVPTQSTRKFLKSGVAKTYGKGSSDDRGLDSATMNDITKDLGKLWEGK